MLTHFFFPLICSHCGESIQHRKSLLCNECISQLHPIRPEHRCRVCFSELQEGVLEVCFTCRKTPREISYRASVFERIGCVNTIMHAYRNHNRPHLAKLMASYMMIQWDQLNWPRPDLIFSAPRGFRGFHRAYQTSRLLADEFGKILKCPVKHKLVKSLRFVTYPTDAMEQCVRLRRSKSEYANRTLLIIDDSLKEFKMHEECGIIFRKLQAKKIYLLAFA